MLGSEEVTQREVFCALMAEVTSRRPDIDVTDIPWRLRVAAAVRRMTERKPTDREAEIAALIVDAPVVDGSSACNWL